MKKFDEVYKGIESGEANRQMKSNYKKQYFNISDEYNDIIDESGETWHYYRYLFNNIDSKNGGKDIEINVVNEALIQAMNA